MLWGLLICCLVVSASHGPSRAQRGGVTLLLGLGAAVLRPGLTGADTGLPVGLLLRRRQSLLNQPQHELPLGQLLAGSLGFALQVRLDPLEEVLRDLEGQGSSIVRCHSCLTSIFLHFVVFDEQVGDVLRGGQARLLSGLADALVQV